MRYPILAVIAALALVLAPTLADAAAERVSSQGSRTPSAPADTHTVPGTAAPMQRTPAPAVAQPPPHLEILRNEDLRPYRATPSLAAKVMDDLVGEVYPKLDELFKKSPLQKFLYQGTITSIIESLIVLEAPSFVYFADILEESEAWIDRCVYVSTTSFKKSNKFRRSLNGKLMPGQNVATRIVVFFQFKSSDLDGAERREINSDLSFVNNVPYGWVMHLIGYTSESGDVIFKPGLMSNSFQDDRHTAQSLFIPRRMTNDVLLSTLRRLGQDCPVPPAP